MNTVSPFLIVTNHLGMNQNIKNLYIYIIKCEPKLYFGTTQNFNVKIKKNEKWFMKI